MSSEPFVAWIGIYDDLSRETKTYIKKVFLHHKGVWRKNDPDCYGHVFREQAHHLVKPFVAFLLDSKISFMLNWQSESEWRGDR